MSDSQSFEVVPGALRNCKEAFDSGDNWWYLLYQNMANWTMYFGDLGVIGESAGITKDYNAALDIIRNKLKEGYPRFQDASTALDEVASTTKTSTRPTTSSSAGTTTTPTSRRRPRNHRHRRPGARTDPMRQRESR
jgi:hypothetical protein